jgi:hypothetical protein
MNPQFLPNLDCDLAGLPGAEYVRDGLADHEAGRETISSLLLEIAAPRLVAAGVPMQVPSHPALAAEIRLYRLLQREHGLDAFSQYNSLLRRLGKLTRALDFRGHGRVT